MTQKKDNTKKLKSISTGNLCSAAQYVAEMVCLRKAEKDNKGSLEYKFWNKSKDKEYLDLWYDNNNQHTPRLIGKKVGLNTTPNSMRFFLN